MSFEAIHADIMLARPYLVPRERTEQGIRNGYSYWLLLAPSKELRIIRLSQQVGNSYELVRSASERRMRQKIRQRFSGSLAELLAIIDEEIDILLEDERLISKPGSSTCRGRKENRLHLSGEIRRLFAIHMVAVLPDYRGHCKPPLGSILRLSVADDRPTLCARTQPRAKPKHGSEAGKRGTKKALNPVRREPVETSMKKSGNHQLPVNSIRQAGLRTQSPRDRDLSGIKKNPRAWGQRGR